MRIRSFEASDLAQLLTVWNKALRFDPVTEAFFCRQVLLDPNFLAANLPVAEQNGQIVGFIVGITRQVPFFSVGLEPDQAWITAFGVDPRYQRQRVGRQLFDQLLGNFAAQRRERISIAPYVPNYIVPGVDRQAYPAAYAFLGDSLGFSVMEVASSMGIKLTGFVIPDEVGALEQQLKQEEGITIKSLTARDLPDVLPFIAEQFGWDWYRHARDHLLAYFDRVDQERICWLVAKHRGQVVGFCQQRGERFGPFGVHPAYRQRGIGRLLLVRCLNQMRRQGVFFSYFLWAPTGAARLYARVGFEPLREFTIFEKVLS
ncbi:MAG: GNAT family N-acetyltransferase [Chloroflexota bacterium]|nr:GNAT family N-acetyltransferase [Chloroflexota bacterium]